MRRETRAMAGAVAVIGMLAAAAPAMAADREARSRVVAVEGVAKGNADRRIEVLVAVPAGDSARAEGDRALAAQGAARVKAKPAPPAVQRLLVHRVEVGCVPGGTELQRVRRSGERRRQGAHEHPRRLEQRLRL